MTRMGITIKKVFERICQSVNVQNSRSKTGYEILNHKFLLRNTTKNTSRPQNI